MRPRGDDAVAEAGGVVRVGSSAQLCEPPLLSSTTAGRGGSSAPRVRPVMMIVAALLQQASAFTPSSKAELVAARDAWMADASAATTDGAG